MTNSLTVTALAVAAQHEGLRHRVGGGGAAGDPPLISAGWLVRQRPGPGDSVGGRCWLFGEGLNRLWDQDGGRNQHS